MLKSLSAPPRPDAPPEPTKPPIPLPEFHASAEPIDPVRCSHIEAIANDGDLVILFHRHQIVRRTDGQYDQKPVLLSAAVSMPWQAALGLQRMLDQIIKNKFHGGAIPDGATVAPDTAKMN